MKTAAVIRHVAFEDLGSFEAVLHEQGYVTHYYDAVSDPLDEIGEVNPDLLVILGGPIGVYQQEEYPFLKNEIELTARRLKRGRPVLGICLGSQIIAAAAGARVYPGGKSEIGWSRLEITMEGKKSALCHLSDHETPVLHWHGDTFDLPQGATLLASTAMFPHQAFAIGHRVLALQFHAEVNREGLERWYVGHCCEISQKGVSVVSLRKDAEKFVPGLVQASRLLMRDWLAGL